MRDLHPVLAVLGNALFVHPSNKIGRDPYGVLDVSKASSLIKLRAANSIDDVPRAVRFNNGYYCDVHQDTVALPVVLYRDNDEETGEPVGGVYFAAVRDPIDYNAMLVSLYETYDTMREAAIAADRLAEIYAEHEREYSEKSQAYLDADLGAEALAEELARVRRLHSASVRGVSFGQTDDAASCRDRQFLRERARYAVQEIRSAREIMEKLKDYA